MFTRGCTIGLIIVYTLFSWAILPSAAGPLPQIAVENLQKGAQIQNLNLAVGEEKVSQLRADVPVGKVLKAYSLEIAVEGGLVRFVEAAKVPGAAFPPLNIITQPSRITANAFDVRGVDGPAILSFIDFRIVGRATGEASMKIRFMDYGASNDDQFNPKPLALKVNVR